MTRLLALAEWLSGESARRQVFEPLVADWHRERRDSATVPLLSRLALDARWSPGFTLTLLTCAARQAAAMEGPMWRYGLFTFTIAIALSIGAETALIRFSVPPDYTWDLLLIAALVRTGIATLAPAMLPALFLLRRDPKATARTASACITTGALLTVVLMFAQASFEDYTPTFGQNERMYQRMRANDRAGRIQYPATALRELRAESTPEQRRARYEQFLAMRAQALASRATPSPWQRLRHSTAPVMAVLFGMIGWGFGGLVRPTLTRAMIWWMAAWLTSLAVEGRVGSVLGLPYYRPAWWLFSALTAFAALSLFVASHRRTGTNR